jgi:Zn-dependent metalloprotease
MRIGKKFISLLLTIILTTSTIPLNFTAFAATSFYDDVPTTHWAYSVIDKWSGDSYGVLQGDGKGNFYPSKGITLGELATILSKTFGYTERISAEVTPQWADEYVEKAIAAGIIPRPNGIIDANIGVTREQAIRYIATAYNINPSEGETAFADNDSIGAEYKPYVNVFQKSGYVVGKGGNLFDPKTIYTRAEAMQVIENTTSDIIDQSVNGQIYSKSLIIRKQGVVIKDTSVKENLIIGQGVGDGEVILDNVTIDGKLVVYGGGSNSIIVKNSEPVLSTVVDKPFGKAVHLNGEFDTIIVEEGSKVIITGTVKNLMILGNAEVALTDAAVGNIEINESNVKLSVSKGSTADKVTIGADNIIISGDGTVMYVVVTKNAKSGVEILTVPTEVTVAAEAGEVKAANGTIQPGSTSTTSNPPSSSGGGGYSSGSGGNDPIPDPNPLPSGEIDFNDIEDLISAGMVEVIQNEFGDLRVIDGTFTSEIVNSENDAANLLNNIAGLFGGSLKVDPSAITSQSLYETSSGVKHFYKYSPSVNGIPVLGNQIIIPTANNGQVTGLFSTYNSEISKVNTTEDIDYNQAEAIAVDAFINEFALLNEISYGDAKNMLDEVINMESFLLIYSIDLEKPTLAYAVLVFISPDDFDSIGDNGHDENDIIQYISKTYYIRANDDDGAAGEIIRSVDNIKRVTTSMQATDLNGKERIISVDYQNIEYEMYDLVRNIKTYSADNNFEYLPVKLYTYGPSVGGPNRAAVSVHANFAEIYDYYLFNLGRKSFDGKGADINIVFDTKSPTGWAPRYPLKGVFHFQKEDNHAAAKDIAGHEFTHAVIEYVVGENCLLFDKLLSVLGGGGNKESLGLNEAYGDILGNLIEGKTDEGRWQIGEDSDSVIRSMDLSYPSYAKYAANYANFNGGYGEYTYALNFDYAAYIMMTDPRTITTVSNVTWAKIFYESLYRLSTDSKFLDARGAIIAAAKENKLNSQQIQAIKDAFDAAGIKEPYKPSDPKPTTSHNKTFAGRWTGTAFVKSDGSLWYNSYALNSESSVKINGLSNIIEVAASGGNLDEDVFYALDKNGVLWRVNIRSDILLEKIASNIKHVVADYFTWAAIDVFNDMWMYDPMSESGLRKVLSDVSDVTSNTRYALKKDGSVYSISGNAIEKIDGLNNIVQICSGGSSYEVYALSSDGKMYVWGHSKYNYGNAGLPHYSTYQYPDSEEPETVVDYYDFSTPYLISTDVVSMSKGVFGLLAKKSDNSMWLWRRGDCEKINFGDDVVSFACAVGWNSGCDYTLFLKSDGSLWTYGYNSYNNSDYYNLTPIKLADGVMLPKTQQ